MPHPRLTSELEQELGAIAVSAGCELVQAEFKGGVLRLFIDREGGVTLADCELVSRQASAVLDVAEFAPGSYTLEVSSPGLDRRFYRNADWARFVGKLVRVGFRTDEGSRRTVVGRLDAFVEGDETTAVATVTERERSERLEIPLGRVTSARLEPEF